MTEKAQTSAANAANEGRRPGNVIAQGEALGWLYTQDTALKGRDKVGTRFSCRPFRAWFPFMPVTQGFTLGYNISHLRRSIAVGGRKGVGDE